MNYSEKETFMKKAKRLMHVEPLESCLKCGNKLLITIETEPLQPDYFKKGTIQKCIVECSQCGTKFQSNYDR